MAHGQLNGVLRQLRSMLAVHEGAGRTDAELLGDYVARRDETALAALVERHAGMVWGVCRRLLHNDQDAEDAFQAAFLVLLRKAAAVVPRANLANWLYGVAHQTARKARAMAAKRRGRERQMTHMPDPSAAIEERWPDLQAVLDEELSRLPDYYRAVIVLCDLEGKTRQEAARHLGIPEGTVAGRLPRVRTLLAKRLTRRGIALSGGALAALLSEQFAAAAPKLIIASAIRTLHLACVGQATGALSASVAALSEGVLKSMLFNNLKAASAALLVVCLIGLGLVSGGGSNPLRAGDEGGRIGYQPPGVTPSGLLLAPAKTTTVEVALDAAGSRGKPYFYYPPDPNNVNHLWKLQPVGDHFMIVSKLGELALDASGGRGNPYLRHSDPTNMNHLWKLIKVDSLYLLVAKVGDGELALDANGGKNHPYFRKFDATNNNLLWDLRKVGDYVMLVPNVRQTVAAHSQTLPPFVDRLPTRPSKVMVRWTKEDTIRELEKLLKRADAAGQDRQAALDEMETAIQQLRSKK